jgi:hypothetical protein
MEDFDPIFYLKEYPDLIQAKIRTPRQAFLHFLNYGKKEGRLKNMKEKLKNIKENILHVLHSFGGGTEVYVDNLISSFPSYQHFKYKLTGDSIKEINNLPYLSCIFIHSLLIGGREKICKNVMEYILSLPGRKFLIIHDYHLLYPSNSGANKKYIEETQPFDLSWLENIFSRVDIVYFNSKNTRLNYEKYIRGDNFRYLYNVPDISIYNERIPYLIKSKHENKVNVALLGNFLCYHKGANLAERIFTILENEANFFIFGEMSLMKDNVTVLGKYKNENIYDLIYAYNISSFLFVSTCEETYSYTLSIALNTGLPIFYNNVGAYKDRMENYENCYSFTENNIEEVKEKFISLPIEEMRHKTCFYELYKNIPELCLKQDFSYDVLKRNMIKKHISLQIVREEEQINLDNLKNLDYIFLLLIGNKLKNTYIYQDYRVKVIYYSETYDEGRVNNFISSFTSQLDKSIKVDVTF